MYLSLLFSVFYFTGSALSKSLFSTCSTEDIACLEKSLTDAIPALAAGMPSINMKPIDPMFLDLIEGNLSILKYKFYNTTCLGYKDCVAKNVKLDGELKSLHVEFHCPGFQLDGKYEIDGRLVILPVEGNGDYSLSTGKYLLVVDSELKKNQGPDGKTYLTIKNYKIKSQPQAPLKFDFKNLFNGQKDLSDAVLKFAHENWAEVAELVQDPIFYTAMKIITTNLNKYLKTVPIDEYISNH